MKNSSTTHLLIGFASLLPCFLQANTFTFTSADVTGSAGPTQEEVDSNYPGTNLAGAVTSTPKAFRNGPCPQVVITASKYSARKGATTIGRLEAREPE